LFVPNYQDQLIYLAHSIPTVMKIVDLMGSSLQSIKKPALTVHTQYTYCIILIIHTYTFLLTLLHRIPSKKYIYIGLNRHLSR